MFSVLIVICLAVGHGNGQLPALPTLFPTLFPTHITFNETTLVDEVLSNVKQQISTMGLNNIRLPDAYLQVNSDSIALTNGTVKNLYNIQRVGDVLVTFELLDAKLSSAFGIYNVSSDQDVAIHSPKYNASHGHIHGDCDNVTIYTVFKIDYATQTLSLDKFRLDVGYIDVNITGMGQRLANDSATFTTIVNKIKGPVLVVLDVIFPVLFNAAFIAIRAALVG